MRTALPGEVDSLPEGPENSRHQCPGSEWQFEGRGLPSAFPRIVLSGRSGVSGPGRRGALYARIYWASKHPHRK